MRHLARNASLILVLVIIAIWAIIPPEKKLRKGRDLAGGVSVVYQVDIKPGEQSKETLDKVIQVVKERLDPNGLLEISIVAEGNDRIDISMPLPSPEVKKLSATFESELPRSIVSPAKMRRASSCLMRLPRRTMRPRQLRSRTRNRRTWRRRPRIAWPARKRRPIRSVARIF
jgi:preprotein translocase subunit SecD